MLLFFAFVSIPLIEIMLFLQLGSLIGSWFTILSVIMTAFIGTILVRAQGLEALNELQFSFSRLRNLSQPLANGAMILVSGALLLTPGFLTDAVGFALLIPVVRTSVYHYLQGKILANQLHMRQESHPLNNSHPPYHHSISSEILNADDEIITPKASDTKPSGWTKH